MARYGRVSFSISYVVDLDDEEMVDEAREMIAEDVADATRYGDGGAWVEVTPDDTATEADIADFLIERRQDRMAEKRWRIRAVDAVDDETGKPLEWSNDLGWVEAGFGDAFENREGLNLPVGGVWVEA